MSETSKRSEPKRRNAPVEPKVKAATGAGAVTPFVLWVLGKYLFGDAAVPDPVAALVAFIVPAIVVFVTGWATRHAPRHGHPAADPRVEPQPHPPSSPPPQPGPV